MSAPTNEERAQRARDIVERYQKETYFGEPEDLPTTLGDILAEFRHLAHEEGIDFDKALLMSEIHFNEEQDEEAEGVAL